jgi:hypothetical protein
VAALKAAGRGRHVLRVTTLSGAVELDGVGVAAR